MVTQQQQEEILQLHNLGLSARKIAEKTNISLTTVCKYIKTGIQIRAKGFIDMTGWKMSEHGVEGSRLTALSYNPTTRKWLCKCDCGNMTSVYGTYLRQGKTKSCGCLQREALSSITSKDLTGQRFGKLTVLNYTNTVNSHGEKLYLCQCDCGNKTIVATGKLTNGDTSSCGCILSKGEAKVQSWLENHNIKFEAQKTFPDLKLIRSLKFDFYLPDQNILIEFQGIQHSRDTDFGKQQREITDLMKKQYCEEKNIMLYEIWFYDDIDQKLEELLYNQREG